MKETILVTGAAGFIGFHVAKKLIANYHVIGIDNLNDYYDPNLKKSRLDILKSEANFIFYQIDISDKTSFDAVFAKHQIQYVIHLAAQAGVRYSITNPYAYLNSNLSGFLNLVEACRNFQVKHVIYASSSSVYGANKKMPFSTRDNVDHPISLYAATKKSNELIAHTYSALFKIPTTGLRFFTVYGPWGRPDMAMFLFTKAILEGRAIDVYNHGKMKRDFTYIDDIVESIFRLVSKVPTGNDEWTGSRPDPSSSFAPYKIYNIGNHQPVELGQFIEVIENKIGKKAIKNFLPLQSGDVVDTYADVAELSSEINFQPSTPIEYGISKFVDWYREFYHV